MLNYCTNGMYSDGTIKAQIAIQAMLHMSCGMKATCIWEHSIIWEHHYLMECRVHERSPATSWVGWAAFDTVRGG